MNANEIQNPFEALVLSPANFAYRKEFDCACNAPLSCAWPQKTLTSELPSSERMTGARFCLECGFPTVLSTGAELQGKRGTYLIEEYLGARGWGRLYSGRQLGSDEPVTIKEYLLPKQCFNEAEAKSRCEVFERVTGLAPVNERLQIFRLVRLWETFKNRDRRRCYTIVKEQQPAHTLRQKLAQRQRSFSNKEVRRILMQVLQTLEFLHGQKFRFPSGQTQQGLAHGNLNLESLLLREEDSGSHVYLCDLGIWECLFDPLQGTANALEPKGDLIALGRVCFALWTGAEDRSQPIPPWDPEGSDRWPDTDPALKQYLLRLLDPEKTFPSVSAAREALRQLSAEKSALKSSNLSRQLSGTASRKVYRKLWFLLAFLVAFSLVILFFQLTKLNSSGLLARCESTGLRLEDIRFPSGEHQYAVEKNGPWQLALSRRPFGRQQRLKDLLARSREGSETTFREEPRDSTTGKTPLQAVLEGDTEFALTSLTARSGQLPEELTAVPVAYDGLIVYMSSSSDLLRKLGGKLSLEQLRQLYTGELENWGDLARGSKLKVAPYRPTDPEAVRHFQKLVLKDNPTDVERFMSWSRPCLAEQTMRDIDALPCQVEDTSLGDREVDAGVISFTTLSSIFQQCSVYPLALSVGNRPAVQVFRRGDKAINPQTYHCDTKIASPLNKDVFRRRDNTYPLSFLLYVVRPLSNDRSQPGKTFSELLGTREGRDWLSKVGLVPLC